MILLTVCADVFLFHRISSTFELFLKRQWNEAKKDRCDEKGEKAKIMRDGRWKLDAILLQQPKSNFVHSYVCLTTKLAHDQMIF